MGLRKMNEEEEEERRILRGHNSLKGPFDLNRTGKAGARGFKKAGNIPLMLGDSRYALIGNLGEHCLKDVRGEKVIVGGLDTLLAHVSKIGDGCKLMNSQVYTRIILDSEIREGFRPIYEDMIQESRGTVSKHTKTLVNNLFILDPFGRGSEHLSPELLEYLKKRFPDQARAKAATRGFDSFAVFLTDMSYYNGKIGGADHIAPCPLFWPSPGHSDTSNLLGDPQYGQRAKRLLRLVHGITLAEEVLFLDYHSNQNGLWIHGNGPIFYVYRATAYPLAKYQVEICGEKEVLPAKGRIIQPTTKKPFVRNEVNRL